MALVERLTMGSGAGASLLRLASLSVSGVSATGMNPPLEVPSDVEPGRDQDVLDGEGQPQDELDGEEPEHRDGEELEGQVLQDARPRQQLLLELAVIPGPRPEALGRLHVRPLQPPPQHQPVEEEAARDEDGADDQRAEDGLPRVEVEERQAPAGDDLVQVAVAVEDHGVVIPRLPRPEPDPTRPADE